MDFDELVEKIRVYSFNPIDYQYFNQLLNHRTVIFNDDVESLVVETVYIPLRDFENDESNEPVTLILNSSGGSVADGFFLAHYIKNYKKPLNIIVPGYACSMAAVILAGGGNNPNVTRSCFPCTYGLIHDGYVALSAAEAKTANDIMAFNDNIDKQIKDFFVSNTNITEEMYDAHSRHQWFLTAEEMKKLNLVDVILGGSDDV